MAFTYFFRDIHTLEQVVRHMVPWTSGHSRVRIWDAGCAMGQEAYSLAILLAENMGRFAFRNICIDATDIDTSNLFGAIISEGIYSENELKRMPQQLFKKYFQPSYYDDTGQVSLPQSLPPGLAGKPPSFKVVDCIRKRVSYQKHDLLSFQPIGDGFSLILCKNVLLHFQYEERVEVIKMFHRSLSPGGFFATEQTQKLPREVTGLFEQVTGDAQLFRKV